MIQHEGATAPIYHLLPFLIFFPFLASREAGRKARSIPSLFLFDLPTTTLDYCLSKHQSTTDSENNTFEYQRPRLDLLPFPALTTSGSSGRINFSRLGFLRDRGSVARALEVWGQEEEKGLERADVPDGWYIYGWSGMEI